MTPVIACIVEGHGEVPAVPILIRRIVESYRPGRYVRVPPPIRQRRDRVLGKPDELHRAVEFACRKATPEGGVLILMDADADPACRLGPRLLSTARAVRPDRRIAVVLAVTEFESWFLAGAEPLRGRQGLPLDLVPPDGDPEGIRGAKEWLRERMPPGRTYSEVVDQPKLAAALDVFEVRRRSASFDKLVREVLRLVDGRSEG